MSRGSRYCATPFGNTFDDTQYRELALLTGPDQNGREHGYTFLRDVAQRFVPNLLLEAFPDRPVDIRAGQVSSGSIGTHSSVRVHGKPSEAVTTGLSASGARIRGDDYQHLFAWISGAQGDSG